MFIPKNKGIFIFGFGLSGRWVSDYLRKNGYLILGFIDSDKKKHGYSYNNIEVFSIDFLRNNFDYENVIINTIVDIQDNHTLLRDIANDNYLPFCVLGIDKKEIQSIENSTLEDDEYLEYSINAVNECQTNFLDKNKLHLRSIDIVVTERCSLKCKDCSNLMQYFINPKNTSIKDIKNNIDKLLLKADAIYEFRVIGGEPMVNREIYEILELLSTYKEVSRITIFTNATVPLKEEKLKNIPKKKLNFSITDYGDLSRLSQNYSITLKKLSISHRVHPPEYWTDSGTIVEPNKNSEDMKKMFSECCGKNLFTLIEDRIYRCPFAANLETLLPEARSKENSVKLSSTKTEIKDYLYDIEYLPACNFCKGRSYSSPQIVPALQTKKPLPILSD